jgi:hypothetical protein
MADQPPPPGLEDFEEFKKQQHEKPSRRNVFADLMEDLTDAKPDLPSAPTEATSEVVDPQPEPAEPDPFDAQPGVGTKFDRREDIDANASAKVQAAAAQGNLSPPGLEGVAGDGLAARPPTPPEVTAIRERLWSHGHRPVEVYSVINGRCGCGNPKCGSKGKHPKGSGWQLRAQHNPPDATMVTPSADALNTGIWCGGFQAIDIDIDDPDLASRARSLAVTMLGETIVRYRPNSPRVLLLYRVSEGEPGKTTIGTPGRQIEVLGHGQQFVAFGLHASGVRLEWDPQSPADTVADDLPAVNGEQIAAFLAAAGALLGVEAKPSPGPSARTAGNGAGTTQERDERAYRYCRKALDNARDELARTAAGGRNNALNNAALGLGHLHHHGAYTEAEAHAALAAACDSNGLLKDSGEKAVRDTFDSGWHKGVSEPKELGLEERPQHRGASHGAEQRRRAQPPEHLPPPLDKPISERANGLDDEVVRPDPLIFTLEHWINRDLAPADYLLGDLFSTTCRTLFFGPTGIGKTNFGFMCAPTWPGGRNSSIGPQGARRACSTSTARCPAGWSRSASSQPSNATAPCPPASSSSTGKIIPCSHP